MSNETYFEPDFKTLFESAPGLYMVLDPGLRIVAATDAYLQATLTRRADVLGRYVFDVFPDNPNDLSADAVRNSTVSFDRVRQFHVTDAMGLQRHDVRKPESEGGGWEVRYWIRTNSPILNADGSLAYILHRVEDVTELRRLQQPEIERADVADVPRTQVDQTRVEIAKRKRAEEALRESQATLQTVQETFSELVERAPFGIYVVDSQFRIAQMNAGSQSRSVPERAAGDRARLRRGHAHSLARTCRRGNHRPLPPHPRNRRAVLLAALHQPAPRRGNRRSLRVGTASHDAAGRAIRRHLLLLRFHEAA